MGCPWLLVHEVSVEQNGFASGLMARGRFRPGRGWRHIRKGGNQAEKRGILMNFFIENVRNVRSKACFGGDLGADPGNLSMLSVLLSRGRGDARSLPRDGRPVDCVEAFLTFSGGAGSSSG